MPRPFLDFSSESKPPTPFSPQTRTAVMVIKLRTYLRQPGLAIYPRVVLKMTNDIVFTLEICMSSWYQSWSHVVLGHFWLVQYVHHVFFPSCNFGPKKERIGWIVAMIHKSKTNNHKSTTVQTGKFSKPQESNYLAWMPPSKYEMWRDVVS